MSSTIIGDVDVLDKGYVRLVTWMPWNMVELHAMIEAAYLNPTMGPNIEQIYKLLNKDDLTQVNAAYASFKREADEIGPRQESLLRFLAANHESSPSRHGFVTLEIKAPIGLVGQQWFKYRVGGAHTENSATNDNPAPDEWTMADIWMGEGRDGGFADMTYARNEVSRRYVIDPPEFYIPDADKWRTAPANKKQGSGPVPMSKSRGEVQRQRLIDQIEIGIRNYEDCLADPYNGSAELARLHLHYTALYTVWRWTGSVQAIHHFLRERLAHNAQYEITQYAKAVYTLVSQQAVYPYAYKDLHGLWLSA